MACLTPSFCAQTRLSPRCLPWWSGSVLLCPTLVLDCLPPAWSRHGLTMLCLQCGRAQSRNGGRRGPGPAPTPGSMLSLPPGLQWLPCMPGPMLSLPPSLQWPPCMLTLELGVKGSVLPSCWPALPEDRGYGAPAGGGSLQRCQLPASQHSAHQNQRRGWA